MTTRKHCLVCLFSLCLGAPLAQAAAGDLPPDDAVRPDPVLSPEATDPPPVRSLGYTKPGPAPSPEATDPPPVRSPGYTQPDAALSPEQTDPPAVGSPGETKPDPALSPD